MSEQIDRRSFLASAGIGAVSLALGTGIADSRPLRRALSKPTPGSLARAIRGPVIAPGSPGFASAAHVYNEAFDYVKPFAVARPLSAADVQAAVRWAVANSVPMRARGGGHSYAGYSTLSGGVVLDLRQLKAISVNRATGTATVGAGVQLIDLYAALAAYGATVPAGSCPSVGVAGHALGGGMGLAGRNLGLASDSLLAAQIATADGRLRTVNARTDPDLLWALRGGGGGNFGVVTQFTFRIHPIPARAAYFFVNFPWSSAADAIEAWLSWAPHTTQLATSILHLSAGAGSTSVDVTGQYFGPSSALGPVLAPLRQVPGVSIFTGDQDYLGLQLRWAGCLTTPIAQCHTVGTAPFGTLPRADFNAKSDYVAKPFPVAARNLLVGATERRASLPGSGAILFDSYGGAINRVHPNATAFVHRDQLSCIQYLTYNDSSQWIGQTWASMRPYVSGTAYQNYIDARQPNWQHAYYAGNYARLEATRERVDPDHRFNFPQAIGR
ncbi:MAG: FAD-dependent oxidoreductase [Solirubrobacteraceae bacterium]